MAAAGFVVEEEAPETIVAAARRSYPATAARCADGARARGAAVAGAGVGARWESLTAREQEVAQLLAQGVRNRQLGTRLGISEHTVETHVGQLLRKL
ncbi:MAG: LuxR C-terminal-related transcriptional regulator, partial [Chloroflexota bacterium]|nr:LuxR C-terminal-related transcriptional regulator [Chloroflexota bacterium]